MLNGLYPARASRLREAGATGGERFERRWLAALILLCVSHPLWLVFLHTHARAGGNRIVIFTEVALLAAAALPLPRRRMPLGLYLTGVLLLVNAIALGLLRDSLDPKPLRDLLVPLVFFAIGMTAAAPAAADRVLRAVVWLVLGFAFFEFLALDLFTRLFDIQSFFLERGVGDPNIAQYRDDRLVASAIRPEGIGRTLLPFLGAHRVSSVFIEPVSLGNFAVVCGAWGLAKDRVDLRNGAFFVVAALVLLVLSDSRFGIVTFGLLVTLRLALVRGAEPLGIAFPFACVAVLIVIGIANGGDYTDSFIGRLTLTGTALLRMKGGEIFGVVGSTRHYFDMGYPYILANFGLLACLALWLAFWMLPRETTAARRFHLYVALYLTLILCVSGNSAFAFKTSAVLWFLLGTVTAAREPPQAVRTPRPPRPAAGLVPIHGG